MKKRFLRFGAAPVLLGAYALFRPQMLRWGATEEEVRAPFPGAQLVPDGKRYSTMAATLDAPPSAVWPWLVQMGYDKGGFYSWNLLDNLGKPSADRIHPEWQHLVVGDRINAMGTPCFEVAALEPERFLALRGIPLEGIWAFELVALDNDKTRLIVTGYGKRTRRWLDVLAGFAFWEPAHWIMQMRQFDNLKRRVA